MQSPFMGHPRPSDSETLSGSSQPRRSTAYARCQGSESQGASLILLAMPPLGCKPNPKAAAPCCVASAPSQTGSIISVYRAVAVALGLQALHWHLGCRDSLFSPCPGGLSVQEDIHAGNDWKAMLAHSQKRSAVQGVALPSAMSRLWRWCLHSRSSGFGTLLALLCGHGTRTNAMFPADTRFVKGAGEGTVRKLGTDRSVP